MSTRAFPPSSQPRIKIVDVAREPGVSATTVSHALNGRGYVDPRTREAVKAVAARLGYRPNRIAQQLRSGRTNAIALVSSMPFAVAGGPSRLGFMMEVAAVAASVALSRKLALILVPPAEAGALALDDIGIDGALVIEPAAADRQLARLLQRGLPVVTIGKQPGATERLSCVDLHSEATTTQLLTHLAAQGACRIALLTGTQQRSPYTEAVSAYAAFAAARRMKPIVFQGDEKLGEEAGRLTTLEMMARHPTIDAICAPVDAFAVGAVRALHELGRSIPGDVKVATRYDGLRARHCNPPLTALNLHLEAVATQAIELLLEQLDGACQPSRADGPPAELLARESTRRD
ncbi:MAG TPA: LacI family DNA-binding transcriptional regulator [Burkholderiaceae bacterium]|jgi:DNA-binding LacI/PurR family transcriptional regulator